MGGGLSCAGATKELKQHFLSSSSDSARHVFISKNFPSKCRILPPTVVLHLIPQYFNLGYLGVADVSPLAAVEDDVPPLLRLPAPRPTFMRFTPCAPEAGAHIPPSIPSPAVASSWTPASNASSGGTVLVTAYSRLFSISTFNV
eukprot:CAMPEP_0117666292 /NCGR_PEP_ID=MMETSP0804-20121206/10293_1 /TAXON_ID=1074897 /ORGANISM="Tetraselmis astigmatica, Strain CCMP880" /LENGTH=143 /DNA_ID=CAMNT_0005473817 /DNA_START=55 /DNA_END=487 /DNA_ORIENTATION=-